MRNKLIVFGLVVVMLAGIIAPSTVARAGAATPATPVAAVHVSSVPGMHAGIFDKTRFLLHLGAAYYAFHHFVWKRYQEGGFASGAHGRTANIVKAAIALLFTYHELKVSYGIANGSNSKLLHALVSPLNALIGAINAEHAKLTKGDYSDTDITKLNDSLNSFGKQSSSNGYSIKDIPAPVPGAS